MENDSDHQEPKSERESDGAVDQPRLVRLVLEITPEQADKLHWGLCFALDEGPPDAGWKSKEMEWLCGAFEEAIKLQKSLPNETTPISQIILQVYT